MSATVRWFTTNHHFWVVHMTCNTCIIMYTCDYTCMYSILHRSCSIHTHIVHMIIYIYITYIYIYVLYMPFVIVYIYIMCIFCIYIIIHIYIYTRLQFVCIFATQHHSFARLRFGLRRSPVAGERRRSSDRGQGAHFVSRRALPRGNGGFPGGFHKKIVFE